MRALRWRSGRGLDGLRAFALALCLLFAQHHAGLHWLSHALDAVEQASAAHGAPRTDDGRSPAAQTPCADCTAIAALDALPPAAVLLPTFAAHDSRPGTAPVQGHRPAPCLAYRSRGPPLTA